MIASHYAEPLARHLKFDAPLLEEPDGAVIAQLELGASFDMLDSSRGWAWGYAADGRVGYVVGDAVGA